MNLFLMHWAIFLFLIGLVLSLPLGAVFYLNSSPLKSFFTNPRKLKAAHLDFILQAFSVGLVFLLEAAMAVRLPVYAVVPLAFGTFCNPFIFLLEATPLYRSGMVKGLYQGLKAASPAALFFAWFVLAFQFLPAYLLWSLATFVVLMAAAFIAHRIEAGKIGPEEKLPANPRV